MGDKDAAEIHVLLEKKGANKKSIALVCICFSTLHYCFLFPFAVFYLEI